MLHSLWVKYPCLVPVLCAAFKTSLHQVGKLSRGPLSTRGSNTSVQLLDEVPAKPALLCMIQYTAKTGSQTTFTLWSKETRPPSDLPHTHSPHLKQHIKEPKKPCIIYILIHRRNHTSVGVHKCHGQHFSISRIRPNVSAYLE